MEKNELSESNSDSKIKSPGLIKSVDVQVLSDNYISFTETSASKDRTVRRISLPIIKLWEMLEVWKDEGYKTVTIAAGRTDGKIGIVMLGAGDDSSVKEWVNCYDVFSEAQIGKPGDNSGKLFCPPPAVCELSD